MSKHPHAEKMDQYAQDAMETDKPWRRWSWRYWGEMQWADCDTHPQWHENIEYRRKPQVIYSGPEGEIPEPYGEVPTLNKVYYIPVLTNSHGLAVVCRSDRSTVDRIRVKRGLVHLYKESAIQHAKVLIRISGGEVE